MALNAENISLVLKDRQVLSDVSLQLDRGLVGLVGPNGAGKSSLLRVLAGIWMPTSGDIVLGSDPVESLSPIARAKALSFLPPERDVTWSLPACKLVALGRYPHVGPFHQWTEQDEAAVTRALEAVDGIHLAHRPVSQLSNGERARILLARALAVEADILLVDEATAALDPGHQFMVMDVLKAEAAKGRLVVAALHDLQLAHDYCDRVIVMYQGRTAGDGAPKALLTPDLLARIYGIHTSQAVIDGRTTLITHGLMSGESEV